MRIREAERDEKQEQLAEAMQAEGILHDQVQQIAEEIAQLRDQSTNDLRPGSINPDIVMQTQRYELLLRNQMEQIEGKIMQVQAEVERRRDLLVEAEKQVKVLEKLRERRESEFKATQMQIANKQMDEIAQRTGQRKS